MKADESRSFLPDFCHIRAVYAVVISALLLAVVLTLASHENWPHLWQHFSTTALYVLWIVLFGAGVICLLKRWLGRMRHGTAGLIAWLIMLAAALAVEESAWWLLPVELMEGVTHDSLRYRTLGITAILAALVLRYLYENHQQRQRELAESRARFTALQARIRPHFLFNSLNTVISLVRSEPDKAEDVLYALSDLFRANLGQQNQAVSLEQELELTRQYLFIEQLRLGNRLKVEWDLHGLPRTQQLPALLLQPLAENAVLHGVEKLPGGGVVRIHGRVLNGSVILSVSNSLPESTDRRDRTHNQMALDNIRQRLQVFFGEQTGMSHSIVDDYYQVRLWFPLEKQA